MAWSTISSIDLTTDVIATAAAHGLATGDAVGLRRVPGTGAGGIVAVLPTSTPQVVADGQGVYFARVTAATMITLHSTPAAADAGNGAINFTVAADGTIHLQRLSVRERIVRAVASILSGVSGITSVKRWTAKATDARHGDVLIAVSPERAVEGPQGNAGFTDATMEVFPYIVLQQADDDPEPADSVHSHWVAALQRAILDNAGGAIVEPSSSVTLAWRTTYAGCTEPPVEIGQREFEAGVRIAIDYRTPRDDPYTPTP